MITRSSWTRGPGLAVLVVGLLAVTDTDATAAKGGRSGGHAPRPPHVSAPRQSFSAPRVPRAAAPARANISRGRTASNTAHAHTNNAKTHANNSQALANNSQARVNNSQARTNRAMTASTSTNRAATGHSNAATSASLNSAMHPFSGTNSASTYTYGTGNAARLYRAYGYGRGYRNRYYGGRYGYGRSQGNNRAIVARLRSVHASLARVDHDYQGHRVRAMHAVSMAIRQLSHRSMVYSGVGFAPGMNNGAGRMNNAAIGMNNRAGVGMRRSGLGQSMTQAQSDARMSQSLRTLQGIGMQLGNQGNSTMGHARARGHVYQAIHELTIALAVR